MVLLIWMILFRLFIYVEFGVAYFIISLFFILWKFGFRNSKDTRDPNEFSVYSAFNPEFERLDGIFYGGGF